MPRDSKAYIQDIREAATDIMSFVQGKSLADYVADTMLRAAVERKFMILGEAICQLKRQSPELVQEIPDVRDIIGFRNQLVHSYATIADDTVWSITQTYLPELLKHAKTLLEEVSKRGR